MFVHFYRVLPVTVQTLRSQPVNLEQLFQRKNLDMMQHKK